MSRSVLASAASITSRHASRASGSAARRLIPAYRRMNSVAPVRSSLTATASATRPT
jgi:hypothetical protein